MPRRRQTPVAVRAAASNARTIQPVATWMRARLAATTPVSTRPQRYARPERAASSRHERATPRSGSSPSPATSMSAFAPSSPATLTGSGSGRRVPRCGPGSRGERERAVGAHDLAPRDERSGRAGGNVDRVALAWTKPCAKRVEGGRVEAEPVAGGVPPLRVGQLRVPGDSVLDARQHFDRSDERRAEQAERDDRRADEAQPKSRTPRRTRIALNPSRHVIFFPSAYVRP